MSSMRMNRALIHWYCASADHRDGPQTTADKLTIHQGQWAFCQMDSRASEHDWQSTSGIELERDAPLLSVVHEAKAS